MFYVYIITNIKNNKVYIGRTKNPKNRWSSHVSKAFSSQSDRHNYPLYSAIRKYGVESFKFEIINVCENYDEANVLETQYIKKYRSNINVYGNLFGYNLTAGGEGSSGFNHSKETKSKMSLSHIGLKPTQENLDKRSKSRTGVLHTQETKDKLSILFSGENSARAKINWEIVELIRSDHINIKITYKQLSLKYNVSISNIGAIIRNEIWRK